MGINKEIIKLKTENYKLNKKIKKLENYIDDLQYELKYGHKKKKVRFELDL